MGESGERMRTGDRRVPAGAWVLVLLGPLVFAACSIAGAALADVVTDVVLQSPVGFSGIRGEAVGVIARVGLAAGVAWGVVSALALVLLRRADVALAGAIGAAGAMLAVIAVLPRSYEIIGMVAISGGVATFVCARAMRRLPGRQG